VIVTTAAPSKTDGADAREGVDPPRRMEPDAEVFTQYPRPGSMVATGSYPVAPYAYHGLSIMPPEGAATGWSTEPMRFQPSATETFTDGSGTPQIDCDVAADDFTQYPRPGVRALAVEYAPPVNANAVGGSAVGNSAGTSYEERRSGVETRFHDSAIPTDAVVRSAPRMKQLSGPGQSVSGLRLVIP
jgi:hypothetical protein